MALARGDGVRDPVRADLARVVVADRHPGRDAGPEHEQVDAGPALGERLVLAHELRHRRAEDEPLHRFELDESGADEDRELVGRVRTGSCRPAKALAERFRRRSSPKTGLACCRRRSRAASAGDAARRQARAARRRRLAAAGSLMRLASSLGSERRLVAVAAELLDRDVARSSRTRPAGSSASGGSCPTPRRPPSSAGRTGTPAAGRTAVELVAEIGRRPGSGRSSGRASRPRRTPSSAGARARPRNRRARRGGSCGAIVASANKVETCPCPGTSRSGASSASGSSTKSRAASCGCGTVSPGSSIVSSPKTSRSRSIVRGPQRRAVAHPPELRARPRAAASSRARALGAGRRAPRRRSGSAAGRATPHGSVSRIVESRRAPISVGRAADRRLALAEVRPEPDVGDASTVPLDGHRRVLELDPRRGDLGLAHAHPDPFGLRSVRRASSAIALGERLEQPELPAGDLSHRRRDPAVVDRVLDPVVARRARRPRARRRRGTAGRARARASWTPWWPKSSSPLSSIFTARVHRRGGTQRLDVRADVVGPDRCVAPRS